jgi:hypothetical protein
MVSPGQPSAELNSGGRISSEIRKERRMKPFLAMAGGFVVSFAMFVIGLAFATSLLTAEPGGRPGPSQDVTDLWTAQPRTVDATAQNLQRIPAVQIPPDPNPSAEEQPAAQDAVASKDNGSAPVDTITTGSVRVAAGDDWVVRPAPPNRLSVAHAEWCASRYRSYRPEDNSYTSYNGRRRTCLSPYFEDLAAGDEPMPPARSDDGRYAEAVDDQSPLPLQYASDDVLDGANVDPEHTRYCFSRYRSYWPEDNSYQPYGGGPRRQCR